MKSMLWGQEKRELHLYRLNLCNYFFNAFCLNSHISLGVFLFYTCAIFQRTAITFYILSHNGKYFSLLCLSTYKYGCLKENLGHLVSAIL